MADVLWMERLMPNIKPWYWPPKYTCDRVVYVPTRPANLFEYQEEMIGIQGNSYWKTVDTTAASGSSSVKEFLEQMKDYYDNMSSFRHKYIQNNPPKNHPAQDY